MAAQTEPQWFARMVSAPLKHRCWRFCGSTLADWARCVEQLLPAFIALKCVGRHQAFDVSVAGPHGHFDCLAGIFDTTLWQRLYKPVTPLKQMRIEDITSCR